MMPAAEEALGDQAQPARGGGGISALVIRTSRKKPRKPTNTPAQATGNNPHGEVETQLEILVNFRIFRARRYGFVFSESLDNKMSEHKYLWNFVYSTIDSQQNSISL